MEIFAKQRNKPQFQRRTKVKFYFDAKAENVRANRIQVQQLLVNLLHNANDAMTVFGEPRQLDDGLPRKPRMISRKSGLDQGAFRASHRRQK
jgi:hypothetical protein